MSDELAKKYDHWLDGKACPAALVIREHLVPVEGPDGVLFPATFAAGDGFPGGYNIDTFPDGSNVCLIDSVGSQANRIEPLFGGTEYAALVPQVIVVAGSQRVNLLEAGHRAGDAVVRCSSLQADLRGAFEAQQRGDARPLAKIAPTSLVFGVWDSRGTQAKCPRLLASTIRAFDVRKLTRSAVFVPAVDYVGQELLEEPGDLHDQEGKVKAKHPFAQRGFVHVPASSSHGGVIAVGGVRRDATLHLAALRLLAAGSHADETLKLRRYILGLALTAFTYPAGGYLRQGCNLVLDLEKERPREFKAVFGDGRRDDVAVTHAEALEYATATAKVFGVAALREVPFDKDLAKKDLSGDEAKATRKAGRKKTS